MLPLLSLTACHINSQQRPKGQFNFISHFKWQSLETLIDMWNMLDFLSKIFHVIPNKKHSAPALNVCCRGKQKYELGWPGSGFNVVVEKCATRWLGLSHLWAEVWIFFFNGNQMGYFLFLQRRVKHWKTEENIIFQSKYTNVWKAKSSKIDVWKITVAWY